MENQDPKTSPQSQEKEIDLFELLQKSWTFVVKWVSVLLYRLIRFIIFSVRNIHWLVLSGLLGLVLGYSQFQHIGKIYEASSVLYLPHENVLVCIQELENIDLLLKNKEFGKLTRNTNLDSIDIANILSIEYAYGVIVEGGYPNYFVKQFEYNNKRQEKLATNYLQITVRAKKLFSEDTIQMILRQLLVKNEYLAITTKNYLDQQQDLLLLLEKEVEKAQQAAELELAKKQQAPIVNNIIMITPSVDTITLTRPLRLQREKLNLEYRLKLFKKGSFIFVNDFYFTKVLNSTIHYATRWTLMFILIMYGVLFYIKRKKYIKLFIQKVMEKTT